jgi:hypothetical protein
MFAPDVTPPGVYVSEDRSQVESPLSIAEVCLITELLILLTETRLIFFL